MPCWVQAYDTLLAPTESGWSLTLMKIMPLNLCAMKLLV